MEVNRPPDENGCTQRSVAGHQAAEGKELRGLPGAVAGRGAYLVSSGWSQLEMGQKLGKLAAAAHSGNGLAAAGTGQELRLYGWSGIVCIQPPSPRTPPLPVAPPRPGEQIPKSFSLNVAPPGPAFLLASETFHSIFSCC